jgi:glucokinase-like ROK family protein
MNAENWAVPSYNVKNINKHAIIDLIRFTPGGVSRVELARRLNLTRAAITTIVNDLQEAGIVKEASEIHYPTGRKPIELEINPDLGYVIGIDIGATHILMVLSNFSARVLNELSAPFDIRRGAQVCLAEVDTLLRSFLQQNQMTLADIRAIGIGVPGPIVDTVGGVISPPIMPGWDGFPIRSYLEKLWGAPVCIDNDADLGALGEWAYGAGRGENNLAYLKVGTGVGAGLLIEQKIFRGTNGSAGEIGHITIDENGPICSCGNRGCLEAMAGGRAIANRMIEGIRKGQRTSLANINPVESITANDVIAAARRGDLLAQQIVSEAGFHLGTAIASLVNLFNPGMIVIGGNIAKVGDLLVEPIRETVQQRSLRVASQHLRISAALLGGRSTGIGAVVQAISLVLHHLAEQTSHSEKLRAPELYE